jgi:hypothetical protein
MNPYYLHLPQQQIQLQGLLRLFHYQNSQYLAALLTAGLAALETEALLVLLLA